MKHLIKPIIKYGALSAIVAVMLSACSLGVGIHGQNTMTHKKTPQESNTSVLAVPMNEKTIDGVWQLTGYVQAGKFMPVTLLGADDAPMKLEFHAQSQYVRVLNGCNIMSAAYQVNNQSLTISTAMSTRKLCEPELMLFDELAGQLLQADQYAITVAEGSGQTLTITSGDTQYVLIKS